MNGCKSQKGVCMVTYNSSLLCNTFAGIKRINSSFTNSIISASDMQNVELFNTGINSGVGIRTMKGNIATFLTISANLLRCPLSVDLHITPKFR